MAHHPGFVFRPEDHELVTLFLRRKIAGEPYDGRFIHEADVYSAAPATLVHERKAAPGTDHGDGSGSVWYFFCPPRYTSARRGSGRRYRAVGAAGEGCWHSEGGEKAVADADGRRVGHLRKLSYGVRKSPGSTFTRLGWCMVEFGLDQQDGGGVNLVLCKVYRSPRAARLEASSTATSAALSESGCKKRKAADHDHPEAPPSVRPQWTNEQLPLQEIEHPLISDDPALFTDLPEVMPLRAPIFWPEIVSGLSFNDPVPVGVDDPDLDEYMRYLFEDLQDVPPWPNPWAPMAEPNHDHASVEFVQTVHGACPDDEVIARLAAGETVDDLLGSSSPSAWIGPL